MSRILKVPEEIRQWAEARGGSPVMVELPDGTDTEPVLQIAFGQAELNADTEGPERPGGMRLVGWDEWIEALEAKNLWLRVSDDPAGGNEAEYDFLERE